MTKTTATLADRLALRRPAPRSEDGPLASALQSWAGKLLRSRLRGLAHGELTLVEAGRRETFGQRTSRCDLACTLHIHRPRSHAEIAFGGSVGAGESYMAGDWEADDVTALVRIMLANREVLEGMEGGLAWLSVPLRGLLHAAARNTRAGSRRNIGAHYDLGNDFFALFLDPTLMYSCAFFEREDMTLEQASIAKLEQVCRKLALGPQDHLLEIGTGWGSLAIHAARHHGCRVTTTTISREQHALAVERIREAGLSDRVEVLLQDYRDLQGRYDKLVSIEMIEAVGHQYFDTFFSRCGELLAPGGTMLLQAITIADQQYEAARDSVDFIKRHIFPGCCIPSVGALSASIARSSPMRIVHLEDIGLHYARTLAEWRRNLLAHRDRVRALGYPEEFIRMWEFYLCYCEGGFAEQALGDVQMVMQRAR